MSRESSLSRLDLSILARSLEATCLSASRKLLDRLRVSIMLLYPFRLLLFRFHGVTGNLVYECAYPFGLRECHAFPFVNLEFTSVSLEFTNGKAKCLAFGCHNDYRLQVQVCIEAK